MTLDRITVAICTWNRAALLDATLEQMKQLVIPSGVDWELIVVNNNCSDDTDRIIAQHADHLPLRRVFETNQGHSHSRNAAITEADGDLMVWTDDDVLVEPDWIVEYLKAASAWPDAAYFGGTIEPWFVESPPEWLLSNLDQLEGPFVVRRFGSDVRLFSEGEGPFGANMAFRMKFLKERGFDTRRGRIGGQLIHGEDEEYVRWLKSNDHFGVWVGPARVRHYVDPQRMTADYLWSFYVGKGRTSVRNGGQIEATKLLGVPRWAIRQYLSNRWRSLLFAPMRGRRWITAMQSAATATGVISEWRSQATPAA